MKEIKLPQGYKPLLSIYETQKAIDLINQGRGDVLMRGSTQTREFLLPLLDKKNGLRTKRLITHIDLVSMPEYPKLIAIGDVTVTVRPTLAQKKDILRNMVDTLRYVEDETPNIALLALVEQPSFHMNDTIEARDLVKEHQRHAIAACNLVGPIAYDLILSKEAARLKGYDNPLCGEFDGIVAPSLLAGNLIVKGWQMHAHARTCGVIVGAKIPVAITSRSDTGTMFSVILPLSILDISSTSLISPSRCLLDNAILRRHSRTCS